MVKWGRNHVRRQQRLTAPFRFLYLHPTASSSNRGARLMENSLLVTLSRQITLQHKMDIVANNLANINTSGFKGEELKFEEYLTPVARVDSFQGQDKRVSFVHAPTMMRDFSTGAFRQTGNELDVALSGEGFLVVKTPQGERYTRNGQLKINSEGVLVTNQGLPVLGDGGEISFGDNDTNIVIGKDGSISTSSGAKGRLQVVEFKNRSEMKKQGNSLYSASEQPSPAGHTNIIQGSFEQSNVQAMKEMSTMIETVRAYTTISKLMQVTDDVRGKAIQQLGQTER